MDPRESSRIMGSVPSAIFELNHSSEHGRKLSRLMFMRFLNFEYSFSSEIHDSVIMTIWANEQLWTFRGRTGSSVVNKFFVSRVRTQRIIILRLKIYPLQFLISQYYTDKLSLYFFNWAPRHKVLFWEWRYSSTHSLTLALGGGEWSASRLGRFAPGKEPLVPIE
jgi:hypothetical protein